MGKQPRPSTFTDDVDKALNEQPLPPQQAEPEPPKFVPPKSGMSEAGLARCRRMVVTDVGTEDEYRRKVTIHPPAPDNRVLEDMVVRTPQDHARITRSWQAKYRIPPENVSEVNDDGGPPEG